MEERILSICDPLATDSIAKNAIDKIEEKDRSEDTYLSEILANLKSEKQTLDISLGVHRKGEYTQEMANADKIYDSYFLGCKRILEAYMLVPDLDTAKKAEKVWRLLEARNPYLYKMGYDKEIVSTLALLEDLENPEIKEILPDLLGFSVFQDGLRSSITNLDIIYKKNNEVLTAKKNIVAPGAQKNILTDIINDSLMPYLKIMANIKADLYADAYKEIGNYIEQANTKARAHKTRSSQKEEEEETNDTPETE